MLAFYISLLETEQERDKMAEIYEEHRHSLLKYALKITSHNQEMAEDAVHNAFISIINEKEKYFHLDSRDFRYLAVIIVKNKCIDLLRKERRYVDIPMDALEIFLESKEKPIDKQVIISSEYAAIRRHMSSIDEISKQVLLMKYVLGMSYKEIGETLSMTPKHVDTRIFRAKEKVRRLVENESSKNDIIKGMRTNKDE
ncbi:MULTISPECIES: RNA polymerase sigma factor [unclassified Lysinibacillus]|uniref:RNA polymerase sigma factor n=1 Tax=unclassified Lysinibacillus TaxID=2636778 RepID=UPI003821E3BA